MVVCNTLRHETVGSQILRENELTKLIRMKLVWLIKANAAKV